MEGYFVVADEEVSKMPGCACGNESDTWIAGKETIVFKCNRCLYGDIVPVELVYRPPTEAMRDRFRDINFMTSFK